MIAATALSSASNTRSRRLRFRTFRPVSVIGGV
jgi:hypothetical protein